MPKRKKRNDFSLFPLHRGRFSGIMREPKGWEEIGWRLAWRPLTALSLEFILFFKQTVFTVCFSF